MAFKKVNISEIKKMYEEVKAKSEPKQDYRWASLPKKGESLKVRFLPPVGDMETPFFKVFKHYQLPNGEGGVSNYTCLKTWGMECPICKVVNEFKTKFGYDLVRDYSSNLRAYFNVLIKDHPEFTEGLPYIMGFPRTGLVWFLSTCSDDDYEDISDPEMGFWVKVMRNNNNQLQFNIIPKPSPIASTDEEINQIAEQCFDLTKIWRNPDDEYLLKGEELANILKEELNTKLGMDLGITSEPLKVEKSKVKSIESTNEVKEATTKSVVKPDGAPDCFGNFEGTSKCTICLYEIECQQASKGE